MKGTLRRQRSRRDESGVAMPLLALMITVLLGWVAFAVDVGNWFYTANRVQNAADAAALAGVVFMPGGIVNGAGPAVDEAVKVAAANDYPGSDHVVIVEEGARANQLRVTIKTTVTNGFASLFGIDTTTIRKTSVAEFDAPVPMGSPKNSIGNDPESGDDPPNFWVNLAGPQSTKHNGDRFAAKVCDYSVSKCDPNLEPDSIDYATEGYMFAVRVGSNPGQDLRIQLYDPVYAAADDFCNGFAAYPDADERAYLAMTSGGGVPPGYFSDQSRYASKAEGGGKWCAGDTAVNGSGMITSVIVRKPDRTPHTDADNPIIEESSCHPQQFPAVEMGSGFDPMPFLDPGSGSFGTFDLGDDDWTLAETWRRWVTVCTIPAPDVEVGDYIVQLRSNAPDGDPKNYSSAVTTGGHNRMSIRAGFASGSGLDGDDVSVFANGRMPIFANTTATTDFYVARVLPGAANRTLSITLFDMGDAEGTGTLTILPQSGSFPACTFTREQPGNPPGLDVVWTSTGGCQTTGVSGGAGWQGVNVKVDIPIPNGYSCDVNDFESCWVKVNAAFPAGAFDTTTWTAQMIGNPVRLVE